MQTFCSLRWIVIFSLLTLMLFSAPAQAQVTLTPRGDITLIEDGTEGGLFFYLTNNSGGSLTNVGLPSLSFASESGDLNDIPSFILDSSCGSGSTLANGSRCGFNLSFLGDNGFLEKPVDFWTATYTISVQFDLASGVSDSLSQSALITNFDDTATPEPSSLLLLGSGLLGVLGLLRRKLPFFRPQDRA